MTSRLCDDLKKKKMNKTSLTASIVKQDPNIQMVKKKPLFQNKKAEKKRVNNKKLIFSLKKHT